MLTTLFFSFEAFTTAGAAGIDAVTTTGATEGASLESGWKNWEKKKRGIFKMLQNGRFYYIKIFHKLK